MKKALMAITLVLFVGRCGLMAQSEAEATRLIENEQYNQALTMLKTLNANDPRNERVDYLLGKVYLLTEQYGEAQSWFSKGQGHGARYAMNFIGSGAVAAKRDDFARSKSELDKAVELNPKNDPNIFLEIAKAYMSFSTKDKIKQQPYLKEAELYLYKVQKLAPNNPESFVLLGMLYGLQGVEELEQSMYEQAIQKDAKYIYGYLRLGQLYKKQKKYQEAADMFQKAIAVDASFAPAFREMAEMWYLAKKYDKANENMDKYLQLMGSDIGARIRKGTMEYLGEQYDQAIVTMEKVIKDTNSILLMRLLGYSYIKKSNPDADKSMEWLNKYFSAAQPIAIIPSDYENLAKAWKLKGNDSLAVVNYETAIEKAKEAGDPNSELYNAIADIYKDKNDYANRAKYLALYLQSSTKYELKENFALGQSYFMVEDYAKADSVFTVMIEKYPDLHIGWTWRARSNAAMDPESKTGKALPYYQRVLELLGGDEEKKAKYKSDYMVALKYLGSYHTLVTEKYSMAVPFWEKILEIDPNDEGAKNGLAFCKQKGG